MNSIRDGSEDTAVQVSQASHARGDTLRLDLRPGGGFVSRFTATK
jgi:hypothetical protein